MDDKQQVDDFFRKISEIKHNIEELEESMQPKKEVTLKDLYEKVEALSKKSRGITHEELVFELEEQLLNMLVIFAMVLLTIAYVILIVIKSRKPKQRVTGCLRNVVATPVTQTTQN